MRDDITHYAQWIHDKRTLRDEDVRKQILETEKILIEYEDKKSMSS